MAQTSLIIGDTNWAVKEDSLLGYNIIQNNYLPIPIDCVRATTATRVNEQGLIEIVPRNLLQYSQEFENAYWQKDAGVTVDSNVANAPNGSLTADRINFSTSGIALYRVIDFTTTAKLSVYLKGEGANIGKQIYLEIAGVGSVSVTLTAEWNRFVIDANNANAVAIKRLSGGQADSVLAWGIQLEQGSVATEYFPTTNRLDIPRIDYSTGTASLLVEPQRTNVVLQSEDLTAPNWVGYRVDITPNQTTSPNGTTNADLIADTATSGTHWFEPSFSATNGTSYTLSYFVKANTLTQCTIYGWSDNGVFAGQQAIFNLTNGTVLSNIGNGIPNIVSYVNGWYRVSLTLTSTATATGYWAFGLAKNGVSNYLGNGSSLYIWGVQLEAGSYATSYIPTIASSVTRNADIISRTGISGLIGQTEGVIYFENIVNYKNLSSFNKLHYLSNSANSEFIDLYVYQDQIYADIILISGYAGTITLGNLSSLNLGSTYKIAIQYNSSGIKTYNNGVLIQTSSIVISNYSVLRTTPNSYINNKATILFKQYLTNAECIALTTI